MNETIVLGIDCGGTHTDAALVAISEAGASLMASAKTATNHADLPGSVMAALGAMIESAPEAAKEALPKIERATLGTTLAVNALAQDKASKVGLALSSGPGLDPGHFGIGDFVRIVPGGLDHRGVEVDKLYTGTLAEDAARWPKEGVSAIACIGKFSPRNPAHEEIMGKVAAKASGLPVSMGHKLSGRLNFPRRIATAYYNAAVAALHERFLDAVESAFSALGIKAQLRLLKADGGAIPFSLSRREPVQSILSGPAASVMGAVALWPQGAKGCSLLLDMGGTTTDIAMLLDGSPVVDRKGMEIRNRRTLVRSLASISIGVGGDSLLRFERSPEGFAAHTGPLREGPAMAFGGASSTLLDALNTLDGANSPLDRGDIQASENGLANAARELGFGTPRELAAKAVDDALDQIVKAAYRLVEDINSRPIYTLAALKSARQARPERVCLVGGPAECVRDRLAEALGLPVDIAPHSQVANAIGAALTLPTASLEIYADTGKGVLSAPACDYVQKIPPSFTLAEAKKRARELLETHLTSENIPDAKVDVVEADLFATLDDYGRGSKDMRVACQVKPGIAATMR